MRDKERERNVVEDKEGEREMKGTKRERKRCEERKRKRCKERGREI